MAVPAGGSWSAETAASDDSHAPVRPRRCFRAGRSTDGGGVRSAMRVLLAVHVACRPSRGLRLVVAGPAWSGSGSAVVAGGGGGAVLGAARAGPDGRRGPGHRGEEGPAGGGVLPSEPPPRRR